MKEEFARRRLSQQLVFDAKSMGKKSCIEDRIAQEPTKSLGFAGLAGDRCLVTMSVVLVDFIIQNCWLAG